MNFNKNNLDQARSPYLKQHAENPIHWQEWSKEILDYARREGKLILVSVGYSTCHWCHVMAKEAFSDAAIAEKLNKGFVAIKVDREERPDLDHYFMDFALKTIGGGGWPLNVVLTPEAHPFFAGTYFPVVAEHGLPSFGELLDQVKGWYDLNKENVTEYKMSAAPASEPAEEKDLIETMMKSFDAENGGFGNGTKFPPHTSLLFLLSYFEESRDERAEKILIKTLDAMALGGLHDHLQGGFYRYTVDSKWQIPHFEKMLYDQAMHLWIYSLAVRLLKKDLYKDVVKQLIRCLKETFEIDGLFAAGHDADTEHEEGTTYTWKADELADLSDFYEIPEGGNFEGRIHLVKKEEAERSEAEEKLLKVRKEKDQPFRDDKILTSWNALTGMGLLMAHRFAEVPEAKEMASKLFEKLLATHYKNGKLLHSSLNGEGEEREFLEDYAALLLFATAQFEENFEGKELLLELLEKVESFKENDHWVYNKKTEDFDSTPASQFDHPMPSPISLAEMAVYRARTVTENKITGEAAPSYAPALRSDFHNLFVFLKTHANHELHLKERVEWKELPVNSLITYGAMYLDCYNKMCKMFKTKEDLLNFFSSKASPQ